MGLKAPKWICVDSRCGNSVALVADACLYEAEWPLEIIFT